MSSVCQTACDYGTRNLKAGFSCDTFQPFRRSIATSFRPYQIPLPQTLTIYLCCSELLFMKRRSAVCSTATENQMMTLFIDELLSCTYDSSRCSSCKALLVTSMNALEQ
ncbi:hypothetical protein T4A_14352 [Trichinella pseudospiralis]|uniref:Uncharacterized protein n=1 Tax=Trichinella pseudospiralis TaxID=6337 RepID=A0A0V1E6A2_TRIPS|nr:hypothetical protein T4A_14352 [Trichinella pseudospiralis]